MPLAAAILETVRAAGYSARQREDADGHTVEALDSRDGQRYIVRGPDAEEVAVRLAIVLGFDLEA